MHASYMLFPSRLTCLWTMVDVGKLINTRPWNPSLGAKLGTKNLKWKFKNFSHSSVSCCFCHYGCFFPPHISGKLIREFLDIFQIQSDRTNHRSTCDRKNETSTANATLACKLCGVNVPHPLNPLRPLNPPLNPSPPCVWLISIFKTLNAAVRARSGPLSDCESETGGNGNGGPKGIPCGQAAPTTKCLQDVSTSPSTEHGTATASPFSQSVGCSVGWCWNILHTQNGRKTGNSCREMYRRRGH